MGVLPRRAHPGVLLTLRARWLALFPLPQASNSNSISDSSPSTSGSWDTARASSVLT